MTSTETTTALKGGTIIPAAERRVQEGTVELAAGESAGVVSGLALPFTPAKVELDMRLPAGAPLSLTVVPVGDPTADGFAWRTLPGAPDTNGYKFTYRLS